MNRRRLLLLATAAVLVGALWLTRLALRQRDLRGETAALQHRIDARHRLMVEKSRKGGSSSIAASAGQAGGAASAKAPARASSSLGRSFVGMDRLAASPEYAPLLRRELRRQTMQSYGDLFPLLQLPPDRLEAFKQLLDESAAIMKDLYARAMADGPSINSPEFQQLLSRFMAQSEGQIRTFLGADAYEQYVAHQQSAMWRNVQLPEVQSYLGLHEAPPLTNAQLQALSTAYRDTQAWVPPGPPLAQGPLYRRRNERLAEVAGPALDPAQRAALQAYVQFANNREQTLAQFLRPNDPDGVIATLTSSRSAY